MAQSIIQKIQDSEESYLNTTYWDVYPLYFLVQTGNVDQLEQKLDIQLDRFPAGRITKDERKQLEYLTCERISAAKQLLLTTDYSIPQITSLLRFCDQSYFTMVFRKHVGMPPKQYRENHLQKPAIAQFASH